ncbi:hypothetical protein KJ682_13145 [bacterium]|nr:hypothetical protein [bacterium]
MRKGCHRTGRSAIIASWLLLAGAAGFLPAAGGAQTLDGFPEDVRFEIMNATTGQAGNCERLTIEYLAETAVVITDIRPADSVFTVESVPLIAGAQYVVTAWWRDVPYYFSFRGRDLAEGVHTLHVFDTTPDKSAVTVMGLNLVLQRQDTVLRLEYLLQIENATGPQLTVHDPGGTVVLALPAGAEDITAEYRRGLLPTPVPFHRTSPGKLGLDVPLVWGNNSVRVTAVVPWQEGMALEMGSDLPIAAWSILSTPSWLEVRGIGLESDNYQDAAGYSRHTGPALEANQVFAMTLMGGEHIQGPEGEIFAQADSAAAESSPEETADAPSGAGGATRLLLLGALVLLIVLLVASLKRRR